MNFKRKLIYVEYTLSAAYENKVNINLCQKFLNISF